MSASRIGGLGYALWIFVAMLAAAGSALAAAGAESDVFVARAVDAYEAGRYEEAQGALHQALELNAANLDALYYMGLVHVARGRLEEAASAFERARGQAPEDESVLFQLGAVYFHLQRDAQARPLLERVFAKHGSWERLGYYVGVLRYRAGEYQPAIAALDAETSKDTQLAELVRFYRGLALVRLGLPDRALAQIEEAMRMRPASPLSGPAERLRDVALAARRRERRLHLQLRVGGFYDDNVAVAPELGNDPVTRALRSGDADSPGAIAALRADYQFLRAGAFDATATYSFYSTWNSDLSELDLMDHLAAVEGSYRGAVADSPYQLGLQYAYDLLTLDARRFVSRHTASPYAALVSGRNLAALQLQMQAKDFAREGRIQPDDRRDGIDWLAGLLDVVHFDGDKHFVKLGYQWDLDDTDGRNFRYLGNRVIAGAQYTLPWEAIRLAYDFDVALRDYRYRNSTFPTSAPGTVERFDTEYNHLVWATLPLPRDVDVTFSYQHTDARSNLDPFRYQRNVVSLQLGWSY